MRFFFLYYTGRDEHIFKLSTNPFYYFKMGNDHYTY